ncbi:hypothetical protein HGRIS_003083 [Hohenbuehelia grisea]|uniref:F-box domain-containing protein n=1 Tax=Hohenbuehelia grisea TaxID=104357 RepID=A0ABR3JML0_9AGAR
MVGGHAPPRPPSFEPTWREGIATYFSPQLLSTMEMNLREGSSLSAMEEAFSRSMLRMLESTQRRHVNNIADPFRTKLLGAKKAFHGILAPIRRLPSELLSEIFLHALEPTDPDPLSFGKAAPWQQYHRYSKPSKSDICCLRLVCYRWWAVLEADRRPWQKTDIDICPSRPACRSMDADAYYTYCQERAHKFIQLHLNHLHSGISLRLTLERSRTVWNDRYLELLKTLVVPLLPRVDELHIPADLAYALTKTSLGLSPRSLKVFAIHRSEYEDIVSDAEDEVFIDRISELFLDFPAALSSVRNLQLDVFHVTVALPSFKHLRFLQASFTNVYQVLDLLRSAELLEECHIDGPDHVAHALQDITNPPPGTTPFIHPRLRKVWLCAYGSVLSCMNLPALEFLRLPTQPDFQHFISFIDRSACASTLTELHLSTVDSYDSMVVQVLERLPLLRSLDLWFLGPTLDERFCSAFSPPPGDSRCLLPAVTRFSIKTFAGLNDILALMSALEVRFTRALSIGWRLPRDNLFLLTPYANLNGAQNQVVLQRSSRMRRLGMNFFNTRAYARAPT